MKISNAAIIAIALSLPPAAVLAGGSKGGKNGSKNSKASKTGAKAYRYGSYRYSNSMSMSTGDRGVDPNSPTTRPTQTPQPDGGQREVVDQPTPRPTPAPTDRNVVVTPPADSPTTKSPTTPVIPDAPPTTASPMAVITPSPAGVTPSPPPTGATCLLSGFECQLNVSCQGVEACTGTPSLTLIDTNGACNGERACYNDGNTVAYCSCNGDRSCIENGGTINNCACNGDGACSNNSNSVGAGSCNGVNACALEGVNLPPRGNIGDASCNGEKACCGNTAILGSNVCNGDFECCIDATCPGGCPDRPPPI